MLIKSKFDSYCRQCGRPLFEGDLIEYDVNSKKAYCIVCNSNGKKSICKHTAVKQHTYSFTASNRYKSSPYRNRNMDVYCLVCGKLTNIDRRKTMYIQITTEHQHGNSFYKGFSIDSYIQYGENEENPPDLESLQYLYEIIKNKDINKEIKNYAEGHIKRICDNFKIENKINLYNKESIIRDSLISHEKIYINSISNKMLKIDTIKTNIYKLSLGWNLNSDIGLAFLEIYNWVILEHTVMFKSNISPLICGLEMYAIYYFWIEEDRNFRGNIQKLHDNYINDLRLTEDILFELKINFNEYIKLKNQFIEIFNYAYESYIVDPNFKFGVIRPRYNEEYVTKFYSDLIKY